LLFILIIKVNNIDLTNLYPLCLTLYFSLTITLYNHADLS